MGDYKCCGLDLNKDKNIEIFKSRLIKHITPSKKYNTPNSNNIYIATVVIQSSGKYTNKDRTSLLGKVIKCLDKKSDVILLPAGFYKTTKPARCLYKYAEDDIKSLLQANSRNITVCLGIDGRKDKDQIALAINKSGIIGMGRKFHPTEGEIGNIKIAQTHLSLEKGYCRIFEVKGKKIFLAVCYDGFGIRQKQLKNPGVDIIFVLVHRFNPKGYPASGDVYFAKHGFAGPSKQWKCPTFGAVVFFNREIPTRWPTGVLWNQGEKSIQKWKYENNALSAFKEIKLNSDKEFAVIRLYKV